MCGIGPHMYLNTEVEKEENLFLACADLSIHNQFIQVIKRNQIHNNLNCKTLLMLFSFCLFYHCVYFSLSSSSNNTFSYLFFFVSAALPSVSLGTCVMSVPVKPRHIPQPASRGLRQSWHWL